MIRLRALLGKELSHHGWAVLAVLCALGFVHAILLAGAMAGPRTITMLEAHATFMRFFLPIFGLALGHRLVVREYHARTQRFLEALPIRRWEVVVEKYLVGLALMATLAFLSLVAAALVAASKGEPLTARWLAVILVRGQVFTLALFSLVFTMGLLGRWRVPIYLVGTVTLLFLGYATAFEVERFGPFALVGDTLVLERQGLPGEAVVVTLALSAGLTALGFTLALVNEGSAAEAMAKSMSRREKATLGILLIVGLISGDVIEPEPEKPPFAFESDAVAHRASPDVHVQYLEPRHQAVAEAIADELSADLAALKQVFTIASLPTVHVALRETLDAYTFEPVALEDGDDGVLLRAAFTDPAFDRAGLRSAAVRAVLDRVSDGRASFEPNAWIHRGVAGLWPHRDDLDAARLPILRALVMARERRPSVRQLTRYRRIEERFGAPLADGWATSAAITVASEVGLARLSDFARPLVAREPSWGMRAVLDAREHPPLERMQGATGLSVAQLDDAWARRLAGWRAEPGFAAGLREVPRVTAEARFTREDEELRTVRWGVSPRVAGRPVSGTCALVHAALGPFDDVLEDPLVEGDALSREERPCAEVQGEGAAMVGRYGPGDRVFLAVEVEAPALGAAVRLRATREAVTR